MSTAKPMPPSYRVNAYLDQRNSSSFHFTPRQRRRIVSKARRAGLTLCDYCDFPATGGVTGGGLPTEHWCAKHEPREELV